MSVSKADYVKYFTKIYQLNQYDKVFNFSVLYLHMSYTLSQILLGVKA